MRACAVLIAVAVCAATLAGCGGATEGDKAGGAGAPVTLRLVTVEDRGAPYTPQIEEFVDRVQDRSGGAVRVEVVWNGAVEFFGEFGTGSDQRVAGLVQSGKVDMALIPARAWDELGVTSLQALQAPFLLSTEVLVAEVVTSDLADEMLAGLEGAGVLGIALLPEGLRHPVGFAEPLLTPGDFAGKKIRTLPSNASNRLIEALGAEPVDVWGDEFNQAVQAGNIAGVESGFAWGGTLPRPSTVTANVTFFPKVNALVVNEKAFRGLSEEQQTALRRAADDALSHALETGPSEAERAEEYCSTAGGNIAFSSEADVAALEQAAAPVVEALEADAQTAEFIERIRAIKAKAPPSDDALLEVCESSVAEAPEPSPDAGASSFPEGVYRADLTPEELVGYGMDSQSAHSEAGLATLTFEDGRWLHQVNDDREDCGGAYSIESGRVLLIHDVAQCGAPAGALILSAEWELKDGRLYLSDVLSGLGVDPFAAAYFGGEPWIKIR